MPKPPLLLDSSAALALLLEGHDAHEATLDVVRGARLGLCGHAFFETLSVITRLPRGDRRSPAVALFAMERSFPETRFLSPSGALELARELAGMSIGGGAVYDGLVAATAREHGLVLVTRDVRALPTYRALAVELRLVA